MHLAFHLDGGELEFYLTPDFEMLFSQPKQLGIEDIRLDRGLLLMRAKLTAFDVDLLGQRNPDRLTRVGFSTFRGGVP